MANLKVLREIGDPRESETQVKFMKKLHQTLDDLLDEVQSGFQDHIEEKIKVAKVCISYRQMILNDKYKFFEEILSADKKKLEVISSILKAKGFSEKLTDKKLEIEDVHGFKNKMHQTIN